MRRQKKHFILCGLAACLLAPKAHVLAQDYTRPSVISSNLDRKYSFEQPDYNLKAGPVTLKLDAGVRAEFNDNIRLSEVDKESDIIITPDIGVRLFWPVTPFNSLSLNARVGYSKYLDHSELDGGSSISIAPDSDLNFDVYLSHVRLNFHDRFSVQQDPVSDPGASNVASLGRFLNSLGVTATWEINSKTSLTLGYDHTNSVSLNSEFEYTDFSQDQVFGNVRYVLGNGIAVGVEGGAASTRYTTDDRGDATSYHAGLFADWIINPYTRMRVAGGFQTTKISGSNPRSVSLDSENFQEFLFFSQSETQDVTNNSYYANIEIVNRFSSRFTQTFSAGKETTLGVTTQGLELTYARYAPVWELNSSIILSGLIFADHGKEFGSTQNEKFTRYGAGVSTGYRISKKLTGNVGYRFTRKNSDEDLNSYTQNLVYVGLNYSF